jgi:hypothetical protein
MHSWESYFVPVPKLFSTILVAVHGLKLEIEKNSTKA